MVPWKVKEQAIFVFSVPGLCFKARLKYESTDMKVILYSHANNIIFKRKVFHFPRLAKKS